jgi:predicted dehydrogenase
MKTIKVGVVGVGYLGRFHAEKYALQNDVELVGVADAALDRATEVAERLSTKVFRDPLELIGRVDAVSIVVPTALHYKVTKPFLEQGVHVLLEKPITETLEQAEELLQLAGKKRLILQVGHIERFNPAVAAIRPLLKAPQYLLAERSAPFTVRCTDVSVVLDLMIHDLDIVTDLAGAAPREISAAGAAVITNKIDMASARIIFENGCVADVVASRVSDEKKRFLRIVEKESVYLADYQAQQATAMRKSGSTTPELIAHPFATERRDTLAEEIRAFIDSVRGGNRPLVSGVEGKRALALAALIEKNIKDGRTLFVPVSF